MNHFYWTFIFLAFKLTESIAFCKQEGNCCQIACGILWKGSWPSPDEGNPERTRQTAAMMPPPAMYSFGRAGIYDDNKHIRSFTLYTSYGSVASSKLLCDRFRKTLASSVGQCWSYGVPVAVLTAGVGGILGRGSCFNEVEDTIFHILWLIY